MIKLKIKTVIMSERSFHNRELQRTQLRWDSHMREQLRNFRHAFIWSPIILLVGFPLLDQHLPFAIIKIFVKPLRALHISESFYLFSAKLSLNGSLRVEILLLVGSNSHF